MKRSLKQKGNEFVKAFGANDWTIKYERDYFSKRKENSYSSFYLFLRGVPRVNVWKEEVYGIERVYVYIQLNIKPLKFLLQKNGLDDGMTLGLQTNEKVLAVDKYDLVYKGEDIYDYWDELLPIWSQQYHEEILPQLKRFEDLQELHDYDAQFDIRRSIFGSNRIHKRLVIKWLISDPGYKDYKQWALDRYDDIVKNPRPVSRLEIYKKEYEGLHNLIYHLDNLDVESYLTKKPWQEEYKKKYGSTERSNKKSSIITDQLSMLVIDGQLDTTALSRMLGLNLSQGDNLRASDVMILDQSGDIYILQEPGKTILFLSDMTMITTWDWAEISRAHRVLSFMRFEGATMSYQLEYWDHGKCLLSRMESDGLRIQDAGSMQEQYNDSTTLDLIETMFNQMAGRGLSEIYENQPVTQYTIG